MRRVESGSPSEAALSPTPTPHPDRFPKAARLCDSGVFRRLLQGRRRTDGPLELVFDRRPGRPRLGLVTSSRFLPRAVDRNALRRIVRERFRRRQQALDGLDIVIRLRRSLKGVQGWRHDVARSTDLLLDSLAS